MSSIDERVVQMKFDNAQFAKGVADTNSSLSKLKDGLNLEASAKSLQGLSDAGSRFSLANIASSVQDVSSKFSALGIMGVTALVNITNQAVNMGLQFAKSFTVAPIMDGFNEYELKMGSIQTILANTAKDGTNLEQVKNSLEELNKYADKTIYNFGDMTRNIGLFTNAGIKLGDATSMIKGFSNEAAMSGTTAADASRAAQQLSQAISKGKVTLEDWRSLTNAGMGNANMKSGIIDIATAMGTMQAAGVSADAVQKDFNGTLEKGWMTADVMQNYLKIQAGEMNAEQMKSMGLSQGQIDNFLKMQKIAEEAATKVRTWSQLVGTLKEAVGSGWATTWELLIGDFDQATELFTKVSNTLGKIANDAGEARNNLIKGWADGGGRVALIDALSSAFDSLMSILRVVGEAFREIFPPVTAATLIDLTNKFKAFIEGLKPGPETLDAIKRTFKGVFAVVDIGWLIIQKLWGVLERVFKSMDGGGGSLLQITAKIGDFLVKVRDTLRDSEKLNDFFFKLGEAIKIPIKFITELIGKIPALMDKLPAIFDQIKSWKPDFGPMGQAIDNLMQGIAKLKPTGEMVAKVWDGLVNVFKKAMDIGGQMASKLGEAFKGLGGGMADATKGVDFNTILGMLGVAGIGGLIVMVKKFKDMIVDTIESIGDGGGLLDTIKEAFGGITDTLSNMQQTLKASTLILIAGAIALLAGAMMTLSKIDAAKLPAVLAAMTVMFIQLSVAMAVMEKLTIGASVGKMVAIGVAMILLSVAIKILASAMEDLSKLSWEEILKGLVAITGLLLGLSVASRIMSTQNKHMIATGIGLMAVAIAVKILASAVRDFSSLSWDEIGRGLVGVGAVLGALALFTRLAKVNKGAMAQAGGLILLGVALKIIASAVSDFADMDVARIQQGLGALTVVLAQLAIFSRVVNPSGMVSMGIAMVILGGALKIMASAITDLGSIPMDTLTVGLFAMAAALAVIAATMNMMPKNMIVTATALVVVSGALMILANVLGQLGGMSMEEIGKGLIALAAGLIIIAVALNMMTGAAMGAVALIIAAGALAILTPVLVTLGNMSLEQIATGLAALAAVFLVLGLAGLVLMPVIPALIGLGIAVTLLGVGAALAGIGMLAFAAGLTAMAAAGAIGTTVLVAAVTALLGLIPYAFTQIGLGIVAFAKVIGDNIPVFVNLAVQLITGILDGFMQVAPVILQFLNDLLFMLLDSIANNIQRFVDVGIRILVGFLNGIAGQLGNVITAGVNIIVAILDGIGNNMGRILDAGGNIIVQFIEGIGRNASKVTNAAYNTVIKFVDELANTIRNNQSRMETAGGNLASAIIDGMTSGIRRGIDTVANAARNVAQGALDTVKSWLGIKSPSREFMKLGRYSSEGLAIGIAKYGTMVDAASGGVAKSALSIMQDTLSRLGDTLGGNISLTPVITPVLDLSSIKAAASTIGNLVTPPPLQLEGSYARASSLVAATRANQEETSTGAADIEAERKNVMFVQNNYSPKAISPVETYRNTKNQISKAKEVLVK